MNIFLVPLGGGFQPNPAKLINTLIDSCYQKISFWAKIRGAEVPITIEGYKNLYGINDILFKNKQKARRIMVQVLIYFE
jgi:hypothetical protein